MDLQKINAIGRMEGLLLTKPLSELPSKCKYAVMKLSKIQTEYGTRIVAELNAEYAVFLPSKQSHARHAFKKSYAKRANMPFKKSHHLSLNYVK